MKKVLIVLLMTAAITSSCKKDSNESNIMTIEITGVTSATYSIEISDNKTNLMLLHVVSKSANETFEVAVKSGDELKTYINSTGSYKAEYKYRGKNIGGSSAQAPSKTTGTVKIP